MRSRRGPSGPPINYHALKAFRTVAGMTQTDLARRAGIDQAYLSRLESGERPWPSLETTTALAQALDVPVNALLAADPRLVTA